MPGDEFPVVDELVADRLLGVGGARTKLWHAIDHVATRWKRSRSFSTHMSNGVVVVPSSL